MIVRDGTVRADGGRSIDDRVYRVEWNKEYKVIKQESYEELCRE